MSDLPQNDPDISDQEELFRRFPADQWVPDDKINGRRLSSAAFSNSSDGSGTSVFLSSEVSMDRILEGYERLGVAVLTAGAARAAQQGVRRVPLEEIPGHAQIEGRKSPSVRRRLAAACEVKKEPD